MIGTDMAKKDQKFYPVDRDLLFKETSGSGFSVCEVNKALSGANRRLYRQNRVYRVKVNAVGDSGTFNPVDVYVLRDTFMLQRGYSLAMEEWNKSYEEADEVTREASKARWRDFRIGVKPFGTDTLQIPVVLRPFGAKALADSTILDEWTESRSYTTDGSSRAFGLFENSNTYGIIHEFDKKGNVTPNPIAATSEAAYVDLTADLVDAEVTNLQTDGNYPPYDADGSMPTAFLRYVGTINTGTSPGKSTTGYFDAPLGAVYLVGQASKTSSIYQSSDVNKQQAIFSLTVQQGDYKGVAAHEYVEAKKLGA
jgi:hypothetical protein